MTMRVVFNSGVVRLDTGNDYEKKEAVALCFHSANVDSLKYLAMEKAIPLVEGLIRKSHRLEFAFDIIKSLEQQGFEIIKKEPIPFTFTKKE